MSNSSLSGDATNLHPFSITIHEPSCLNEYTTNPVSERFVHKLWELGALSKSPLIGLKNERIEVVSLGEINKTNGPDVLFASLKSNGLIYHGCIEFHICEQHWFDHKHQIDPNYENVIAHIFLEKGPHRAFSGQYEPLFHIQLTDELITQAVIHKLIQSSKFNLPCGYIGLKAPKEDWNKQLEFAEKIYFHELTKRFFACTGDPYMFKNTVCHHIWEQLGVPHNRQLMQDLFLDWITFKKSINSPEQPFFIPNGNTKSVRPNQRLHNIVRQAIEISTQILAEPISPQSLDINSLRLLKRISRNSAINIGCTTINRLNKFVFLPALNAYYHQNSDVKSLLFKEWTKLKTPITVNEIDFFKGIPFLEKIFSTKNHEISAALVAQQRFFCKPKQCNDCYIFKMHFRY